MEGCNSLGFCHSLPSHTSAATGDQPAIAIIISSSRLVAVVLPVEGIVINSWTPIDDDDDEVS